VARRDDLQTPAERSRAARRYWDDEVCGEVYASGRTPEERFRNHAAARHELEPYIRPFARFHQGARQDVLEVGVGMGADHAEWAGHDPRRLAGLDSSPRAVDSTRRRLEILGLHSHLAVGDAQHLPFRDASFDLVYSWGVLPHVPDPAGAIQEIHRVTRPGGAVRLMLYHHPSIVGDLLWLRYGLLAGRLRTPAAEIYSRHLESDGTRAFTTERARPMFSAFSSVEIRTQLSFGDLLQGEAGRRHASRALRVAKRWWPRPLIRRLLPNRGLALLVEATK